MIEQVIVGPNLKVENEELNIALDTPGTLSFNERDLPNGKSGFLPVNVEYKLPNLLACWIDETRQNEPGYQYTNFPVTKNGKYMYIYQEMIPGWFPFQGLVLKYLADQSTNKYDLRINIDSENGTAEILPNIATLKLDNATIGTAQVNDNGIITLPDREYNIYTDFNTGGMEYATALEIDVSDVACVLEDNMSIDDNGEYVLGNFDSDPQAEVQKRNRLEIMRSSDVKKDSKSNNNVIGTFRVNVPTEVVSGTLTGQITQNGNYYRNRYNLDNNGNGKKYIDVVDLQVNVRPERQNYTLEVDQNNKTYLVDRFNISGNNDGSKELNEVYVSVQVPDEFSYQDKELVVEENGEYNVLPDEGCKLDSVNISVNVPQSTGNVNLKGINLKNFKMIYNNWEIQENIFFNDNSEINLLLEDCEYVGQFGQEDNDYLNTKVYPGEMRFYVFTSYTQDYLYYPYNNDYYTFLIVYNPHTNSGNAPNHIDYMYVIPNVKDGYIMKKLNVDESFPGGSEEIKIY